ncbi:ABC transporter ATP-binding protein [Sneathiella sp.]|uniref:ABC transporter ATP-binding protein n=1 Tax=Sneathiella sp. TaxID=1964365 RepID=UPI0035642466
MNEPFVVVNGLKKNYKIRLGMFGGTANLQAVDDLSFEIEEGKTFGLVGESGSGKTTTARLILGAEPATEGTVRIGGQPLNNAKGRVDISLRRIVQPVFQDPYTSLSPRMRIGRIIDEPIRIHGLLHGEKELSHRVSELLEMVGLPQETAKRFPNELSGGQRQRVAIARALAPNPRFIVLDEPVSALDVSIQAQILNLLKDLQEQFKLTYLLISHDLSVVSFMSDRIGVLYLGRFMELGPKSQVLGECTHPYTLILRSAAAPDESTMMAVSGEIPSPLSPPSGCPFNTRCPLADERCRTERPRFKEVGSNHWSACHKTDAVRDMLQSDSEANSYSLNNN